MESEMIDYTDFFIEGVNELASGTRTYFGELYYDMIDAIEDGYTMEIE